MGLTDRKTINAVKNKKKGTTAVNVILNKVILNGSSHVCVYFLPKKTKNNPTNITNRIYRK